MLFRAQDEYFVSVLTFYLSCLSQDNGDQSIRTAVLRHISRAQEWQRDNGRKAPDMSSDDIV